MEKEYEFTIHHSATDEERITVKESELSDKHIDLLVGELLNAYQNMPDKVKRKIVFTMPTTSETKTFHKMAGDIWMDESGSAYRNIDGNFIKELTAQ